MRGVIFYEVFGHFCCDHINVTNLVEQNTAVITGPFLQNKIELDKVFNKD